MASPAPSPALSFSGIRPPKRARSNQELRSAAPETDMDCEEPPVMATGSGSGDLGPLSAPDQGLKDSTGSGAPATEFEEWSHPREPKKQPEEHQQVHQEHSFEESCGESQLALHINFTESCAKQQTNQSTPNTTASPLITLQPSPNPTPITPLPRESMTTASATASEALGAPPTPPACGPASESPLLPGQLISGAKEEPGVLTFDTTAVVDRIQSLAEGPGSADPSNTVDVENVKLDEQERHQTLPELKTIECKASNDITGGQGSLAAPCPIVSSTPQSASVQLQDFNDHQASAANSVTATRSPAPPSPSPHLRKAHSRPPPPSPPLRRNTTPGSGRQAGRLPAPESQSARLKFPCHHPDCGKRYVTEVVLQAHLRLAHKERPESPSQGG
ncbi:hypothetical protein DFJ73DRAFT_860921 [Zopfochytrium polystomum]|nr:hypothetical protein DFJ73DRAFT_860921 [Zopfochytrium polystomum]